jgi:hypothetical protein
MTQITGLVDSPRLTYIIYFICFVWLSWSHDIGHEFDMLIKVDLGYFLCYFLVDCFKNLFLNIELIENWIT